MFTRFRLPVINSTCQDRRYLLNAQYLTNKLSITTSGTKHATVASNNNRFHPTTNNLNGQLDLSKDRELLRNIGIIAHINAGKTTTTERILYHSGSTSMVGDVDSGNTVTDYLVQERDRGITITSAAVTYRWKKHQINLIDTPGHVDFTIEVERSLSVLDGAVTIIDASAGVEAQTVTVWNQALKYNLPNVIFLNKMDKPQAHYKMCLKDLKSELNIRAGLVQLPVKCQKSNEFNSFIDIVDRKLIRWTDAAKNNGSEFTIESLTPGESSKVKLDTRFLEEMEEERERLINYLSDCDEIFAGHVINCDKITDVSAQDLLEALRRVTLDCKFSPVLVGSSFKYIGVQQLMDAIINYLPSPIERSSQVLEKFGLKNAILSKNDPCAFIFKIMHDKRLGALNYLRVCNGEISRTQRLQNLHSNKPEQIKKIYRAFADELRELEEPIGKDDIVVVTGLLDSKTGDILVKQNWSGQNTLGIEKEVKTLSITPTESTSESLLASEYQGQPFELLDNRIIVPKISRMEPVYFCTIESPSSSQQIRLEEALSCLSREDPSFTYEIDSLGVGTICGMGKLHLEITRDRIQSEYGIDSILGPMQVSYRESIEGSAVEEFQVDRMINSVKNMLTIKLYVRAKPLAGLWTAKQLRLDMNGETSLSRLRQDHRRAIEGGLRAAMLHGPSLGYPMIDCDILLLDFQANFKCGLPVISSAASQCLARALARCSPVVLEPVMLLEVVAPQDCNGAIVSDLTATRRGIVLSSQARLLKNSIVIRARAPLATLANYSEYLRVLTSGRGSFSMELNNYVAMSEAEKRNIVRI